jgi:nucleoside-diphosphate-sugar epimerase
MPIAFVTGASGFIGGALTRRLLAEGTTVRALARSEASATKVAELGAEPVRGDLDDLGDGPAGCDLAFHCAAHLGEWGDEAEFDRVNVDGTRNVMAACSAAGVGRVVHVGTEAALLAGQPLVDADETLPLRPDSPALYSRSKAKAEQVARAAGAVVVRPRLVWGPGDTSILPLIVAAVRAGRFAWIGGGTHRTSTTHVDNVVEGLLLGARRGTPGEAYFVTDGEPVVCREFITALLATAGVEAPSRSVPRPLASAVARAGEAAWRRLPLRGQPPVTRMGVWLSSQECTINIGKARRDLGYAPLVTVERGLAELRAGGQT